MGDFVVPGSFLGAEEEGAAGSGAYAEAGAIRSAMAGESKNEKATFETLGRMNVALMKPGTTIIGVVENIVEPIALISVASEDTQTHRFVTTSDYAVLHASRIKQGFVKNVRDELKIGDIIRARVAEIRNEEIHLTIEDKELGVLKAFCSKCRTALKLESAVLSCPKCENHENRKLSSDYRSTDFGGRLDET